MCALRGGKVHTEARRGIRDGKEESFHAKIAKIATWLTV